MKKHIYRVLSLFIALAVTTSLLSVFAAGDDYTDSTGHWAEHTLRQALDDALIVGNGNELRPDDPITKAEAVTILCRVFKAVIKADMTGITDVTQSDWFYGTAAEGVAMGFISPDSTRLNMNGQMTRSEAFLILAEAFQLIDAEPDTSVLSRFTDGENLSGIYRQATASLVSKDFVKGADGSLHIDEHISRAEFLTVLYRIAENYQSNQENDSSSGGTVISGKSSLSNTVSSNGIYFDCTSSNVALQNVIAPEVVLRCDTLNSLSISSSRIDRLVIAALSGDLEFTPDEASQIGTVAIGTGSGLITLGGTISNVEITGNDRYVVICAPTDTILISGSNNTVRIESGVNVKKIQLLSSGSGNSVTINGSISTLVVTGKTAAIDGSGIVTNVIQNASDSSITVNTGNITVNQNYGLDGVELAMTAPDDLPAGDTLAATVSIHTPSNDSKVCQGKWYLNNALVSESDVTLSSGASPEFSYNFEYSRDFPDSAKLSFVLCYTDENGEHQEMRADRTIQLENYSDDYYDQLDKNRVLALVTTGYKGDYTLEWAKENDYTSADKEIWVNAKGYLSKTGYLIWVSIAYQRVNVFTGSAGNWKLDRTFIVGTGAPGKDTPTGVWSIIGKLSKGWTTSTYTVKPVVNFINSSYGFHSRIYYPGTTKIEDARIGFPVSHGCVRMYTEDITWFYSTIPIKTTVVVY